ncbi:hypothetical protein LFM09_17880 [Lentzea alba]|uniref:hypothetical protein n=1 Tax=Lentzea alba TaxID=2714351 RepID=UPI0039BFDBB0
MRRMLFDSRGTLRPVVVVLALVLVPAVVLGLATAGGWVAMAGIFVILAASLAIMMRSG